MKLKKKAIKGKMKEIGENQVLKNTKMNESERKAVGLEVNYENSFCNEWNKE